MYAPPHQQQQQSATANGTRYDYYLSGLPSWKQKLLLPKLEKELASPAADDGDGELGDRELATTTTTTAAAAAAVAPHAPDGGLPGGSAASAPDTQGLMSPADPVSRADGHVAGDAEKNGMPNNRAAATAELGSARASVGPRTSSSSSSTLAAGRHWPVAGADRQVSRSGRPTWYRSPEEIVVVESGPPGAPSGDGGSSDAGSAVSFACSVGRPPSGNGPAFGSRSDSQQQLLLLPPPQPDGCSLRVSIVHQVVSQFEQQQQMEAAAAVAPKPPPRRRPPQPRHPPGGAGSPSVDGFASPPLSPGTPQPLAAQPPPLPPRDGFGASPAPPPQPPAPVARLGPAPFQIQRREGGASGSISGLFTATFVASAAAAAAAPPDKAAPERAGGQPKSAPQNAEFKDPNSNTEVLPARHIGTDIKTLAPGEAQRLRGNPPHATTEAAVGVQPTRELPAVAAAGSKPLLPQVKFAWPPAAASPVNGPSSGQQPLQPLPQPPPQLQQPVPGGGTAKGTLSSSGGSITTAASGGWTSAASQSVRPAAGRGAAGAAQGADAEFVDASGVPAKPVRTVGTAATTPVAAPIAAALPAQPAGKGVPVAAEAAAAEPSSRASEDRHVLPPPARGIGLPAAAAPAAGGQPTPAAAGATRSGPSRSGPVVSGGSVHAASASATAAGARGAASAVPTASSAGSQPLAGPARLASAVAAAAGASETADKVRPPTAAAAAVVLPEGASPVAALRAAAVAKPEASGTISAAAPLTGRAPAVLQQPQVIVQSSNSISGLPAPAAAATAPARASAAVLPLPVVTQQTPTVSAAQPSVTAATALARQQAAPSAAARSAAAEAQPDSGRNSPVAALPSGAGKTAAGGFVTLSSVTTTSSSTDVPPAAATAPNTPGRAQPDAKSSGGSSNEALEFLQALSRRKAAAAAAAAADGERHPETGTGKRVFDTRSAMSKERKVPEYERIFEGGAVVFYNDNVVVANGNLRKAPAASAAKPGLAVKFLGSHLSRIFEYPSEDSLLQTMPKEPGSAYFDDPLLRSTAADDDEEPPCPTQFGSLSLNRDVMLETRSHAGLAHQSNAGLPHQRSQPTSSAAALSLSETNTDC